MGRWRHSREGQIFLVADVFIDAEFFPDGKRILFGRATGLVQNPSIHVLDLASKSDLGFVLVRLNASIGMLSCLRTVSCFAAFISRFATVAESTSTTLSKNGISPRSEPLAAGRWMGNMLAR